MLLLFIIISILITMTVLVVPRAIIQMNINKISKLRRYSEDFKRKFLKYQMIQMVNHVKILVLVAILSVGSTILMTYKLIVYEIKQSSLVGELAGVREEIEIIHLKYQELLNELPVREYPSNGIELSQIFPKNNVDQKEIEKLEVNIANKIYPYFGYTSPVVIYNQEKKLLIINFSSLSVENIQADEIKKNQNYFIEELSANRSIIEVLIKFNQKNELVEQFHYIRNTMTDKLESNYEYGKVD
ncbi:hypothetical protein [Vagococcus xieshaowenii]|uniref:Uncharacterized protein n=1 Tax=Vagococcus xieshaowenii TaxID=2562451 RepID=A0AAJ5EFS2_9ENTE|nr:hypothetical protein [Vagococcus xieshaowenii]QCA28959.1 hypothetical protein E4Z98_06375 [Vagococcus xieshaowenii]TFZ43139.1 hypothetical protein E4031_00800 [Vagococcus xieshaowenii]